ncbi:long-chain-fatty-acid--CoA ligase 4-like [Haemaphysalis longicornis]
MHRLWVQSIVYLIKVWAAVYDIATLPVYFVFQKPWIHWKHKRACFAKRIIEADPSSPYRRLKHEELDNLKGLQTLDEITRMTIRMNPNRPALGTRQLLGCREERQQDGKVFKKLVLGEYEWLTYEEVGRKIELTARGLLSMGLKPRQYVAIFAETRAEWMLTAQACFRANIPIVTLYATLSNDGVVSAINQTEVTHLVTSSDLLPRVLSVVDRMPSITHIVYMHSAILTPLSPLTNGPQVVPFSNIEERGASYDVEPTPPAPDDVAIVMFTSGSAGTPKGVITTHRNFVASINGFGPIWSNLGVYSNNDAYIAYLPLAHVYELFAETLLFSAGARIGYASALTLTDNSSGLVKGCPGDATLLQPTIIPCVPLVLERLRKGVCEATASKGPLFKDLFDYSVHYKNYWLDLGFDTPLLNMVLFKKVRLLLGGKLKLMISSSAPISNDTRQFVRACFCCRFTEAYGLSEACGAVCLMDADDASMGRVGAPISGCYIRLVDWKEGQYCTEDKPNPRGEIAVTGRSITLGYHKNEDLTREAYRVVDGVRWLYTGDIGEFFPDGTLKIIDRKKDLVKLQYGEYISLGYVESMLKASPLVDNVFVYGSSLHTYLVAFVAPNFEQLQRLARSLGKKQCTTLKELCEDEDVTAAASKSVIECARENGLQKTEVPFKIRFCAEEWLPESGLVTPTLKIRRKPMEVFYQHDIEALYYSGEESKLG